MNLPAPCAGLWATVGTPVNFKPSFTPQQSLQQQKYQNRMNNPREKGLILLFSLGICGILGPFLICTGVDIQKKITGCSEFLGNGYMTTSVFFIILGGSIFVIAINCFMEFSDFQITFRCYKTWETNKPLFYTFLMLVAIAQVAACINCFVMRSQLKDQLPVVMKKAMENYGEDSHNGVTMTWDTIQKGWECCGVESPQDWVKISKDPNSCHWDEDKKKARFTRGCLTDLDINLDNINVLTTVTFFIANMQVIGVVVAYCMTSQIRLGISLMRQNAALILSRRPSAPPSHIDGDLDNY